MTTEWTMKDEYLDKSKHFWQVAKTFPPLKEEVYRDHASVFCLEEHAGKVVLEYGCGNGSDTLSLLKRGAKLVVFADITHPNVDHTWARATEYIGVNVPCGDVQAHRLAHSTDLPWSWTDYFDVITSNGCIHHIREPKPVIAEFTRVLKPGGRAFIMLYTEYLEAQCSKQMQNFINAYGITKEEAFGWVTDGPGCPYARSYTVEQGWELLESAGLKRVTERPYNSGEFRVFELVK